MKKEQIKAVLDRVLTWPSERQEQAARILRELEEQDTTDLHLTDEQAAEVERRLTAPEPRLLSLEDVKARFQRR